MRFARSPRSLAALAVAFLSSHVAGLAITLPVLGTTWDLTGATSNVISWSLLPLTYPEPTSNYFDIWIVNAAPGMYSPMLYTQLATYVDATVAVDTFLVPLQTALALVPGPGYQLLLTQPGDATVVYADSGVFNIGTDQTPATGAVATSYNFLTSSAVPTSSVISSVLPTSSVVLTTSTAEAYPTTSALVASSTASGMATSVVVKPTSAATSAPATQTEARILPAKIVGGWEDQGRNLVASGGERTRAGVAVAVGVAAGMFGVGWLW